MLGSNHQLGTFGQRAVFKNDGLDLVFAEGEGQGHTACGEACFHTVGGVIQQTEYQRVSAVRLFGGDKGDGIVTDGDLKGQRRYVACRGEDVEAVGALYELLRPTLQLVALYDAQTIFFTKRSVGIS